MKRLLALLGLLAASGAAHACLFVRDVPPEQWYGWSSALFAGEVTKVEREGRDHVITVKVSETFKGPQGADIASVRVPSRMWQTCRMELPAPGARVLVAFNEHGDAALVPLRDADAKALRSKSGSEPD